MKSVDSTLLAIAKPAPAPHITALNLDEVDAVHWARTLALNPTQPRPQLHIDCSSLKCQRTLGVSHVISQLLLLHKTGASIWLANVNAPLRRCLQLVQLGRVFHLPEPGQAAG
jgi:anti-anti-sigma regulatory factor